MDSHAQVFFDLTITFRTFLRSPSSINFTEKLSTLPAHVLNDASELPKSSIKHLFPKHSLGTGAVIEIFDEDHISSIAKSMSLLVVEVLPRVVNFVVKSGNFKALFLVILRPLLFPRKPALQQFQLTLPTLKKLRRLYENAITSCQKLLQPNINSNGITVRNWVGNSHITLQGDRCIPSVSFPQDSYLLDHKPSWDRSMQVDGNRSNLGQQDVRIRYWIFLELGKQQRLELSILLESRKAKPSFLKVLPAFVQLLNCLLKNLRRDFAQSGKFLLRSWQIIKLLNFTRKLQVGREYVFLLQRASVYQALTTIAPILYLSKRIVKCTTTDFHPLNELLFLGGVWIDSIAVSDSQHPIRIAVLLATMQSLTVNLRNIESLKLTWGNPCILRQIKNYGVGIIAPPVPLT